jgi:hypothetical protein
MVVWFSKRHGEDRIVRELNSGATDARSEEVGKVLHAETAGWLQDRQDAGQQLVVVCRSSGSSSSQELCSRLNTPRAAC